MRRIVAAGLMTAQMASGFAAQSAGAPAPQALRAKLTEEAIKQAVPDGLKHQATGFEIKRWGYVGVTGLVAAPFVAVAKLRGKCL